MPTAYPEPIARLLRDETSPGDALEAFDFISAVAPQAVVDADMARACESGLWLRHHFLDRSHEISQQIETSSGSFWHGIMHRLEGDFGNSKYWFRRVGSHPIFPSLAVAAHAIDPSRFVDAGEWDPYGFVDFCEAEAQEGTPDAALQSVASAEWDLLFDYCFCQSIGMD